MGKDSHVKVAPYQSCIACLKGDTDTAVYGEGEAEWHIALLMTAARLDEETATATLVVYAEHELGCEPGTVPSGRFQHGFRLCSSCAAETGVTVNRVSDPTVLPQRQPKD